MRSPAVRVAVAMLVVLLAGLAILAYRGSQNREDQPVRFGVLAREPIGVLPPGQEACQAPVDLDRSVDELGLAVDTSAAPGPPLEVTVRDLRGGGVLRRARVPGGYRIPLPGYIPVALDGPVGRDRGVAVCATNLGRRRLVLVGANTAAQSELKVGAKPLDLDWAIFFPAGDEGDSRTLLQAAPDMIRRAAVLRPGVVTPALYGVLGFLLLIAGPVLLWRAVLSAADEDERTAARRGDAGPVGPRDPGSTGLRGDGSATDRSVVGDPGPERAAADKRRAGPSAADGPDPDPADGSDRGPGPA